MLEIGKRFTTVGIAAFVDHSFHRVSARGCHDHARAIAGNAFPGRVAFLGENVRSGLTLQFTRNAYRSANRNSISEQIQIEDCACHMRSR